ncbi:MAG: hypothetical protein JNL03_13935 [Prolixibacteraceae bacterium]|nr:hypothetical protein [Prolixibacteraceae bacterium]
MKTKLAFMTLGLLLVCLLTTASERKSSLTLKGKSALSISGQSLTDLGQYVISTSDEVLELAGEKVKTYELNYSNGDSPVLIGVKKTKKCMNFIVHTDNFEVEYICNKHVFGVKRIGKEYQTVASDVINEMMNNEQFYKQRVITQNPKTEEELLSLIACYFPSLIKPSYLAEF